MPVHIKTAIFLILWLISGAVATAEERPAPTGGVLSLLPPPQTTEQSITVGGHRLPYRATAGTLSLLSGEGAVTAEVFYVSYIADQAGQGNADKRARPITFVFNGGPGAASAYLHIGALGPRVIATDGEGGFLAPPQRLIDNPDTWLGMTDLVFVDPVGTGYSRPAPGQDTKTFWGVDQDAASMAAFIRLYLSKEGRLTSPLHLVGESYGGFRVALLAKRLQEDAGVSPTGIMLVSPALEFMLVRPDSFDILHWALELPSLAAVRLHKEGIGGPALRERLAEVERYALGDYLTALASGLERGRDLASPRVAELTGLPLDLVRQNFARIPTRLFAKEFARARGNVLSAYDGTIQTGDVDPASPFASGPDPVLDRSVPALTAAFVSYVRDELNYRTDISYRLLNGEVNRSWDFGTNGSRQGYAGAMQELQEARGLNPAMKVLIVNGYTDLVTPYMSSRYLASQIPALPGAEPIRTEVLEGGHMMYLRPDSRSALQELASGLYEATQ